MKNANARGALFIKECEGVFRLKVPFDDLYTSVFLIQTDEGAVLVDCGTTRSDVEELLLPALAAHGVTEKMLFGILLSHRHDDHAGGLPFLLAHFPTLRVLAEGARLPDGIERYALAGHTADSVGVLDTRTGTLVTGDGLQFDGVTHYPRTVRDEAGYFRTLDRIEADARVEHMLFSHAYDPWQKDSVHGRAEVLAAVALCRGLMK